MKWKEVSVTERETVTHTNRQKEGRSYRSSKILVVEIDRDIKKNIEGL